MNKDILGMWLENNYRRDFLAGLFDALLLVAAPLFASRLLAEVLWKSFRNADKTRSFGRNDILVLTILMLLLI